jgi:hypothetical protein
VNALRRWRLNAPSGYRWTDDDVLDEKMQSFLNGVIVGVVLYAVLFGVVTRVLA